jgi:hypothetical protein
MFSVFQSNSSCLEKLVRLGLDPICDDGFRRLTSHSLTLLLHLTLPSSYDELASPKCDARFVLWLR